LYFFLLSKQNFCVYFWGFTLKTYFIFVPSFFFSFNVLRIFLSTTKKKSEIPFIIHLSSNSRISCHLQCVSWIRTCWLGGAWLLFWFVFRLEPIFTITRAASINDTCFKVTKNINQITLIVLIMNTLCLSSFFSRLFSYVKNVHLFHHFQRNFHLEKVINDCPTIFGTINQTQDLDHYSTSI
jgi:hypothetical protein